MIGKTILGIDTSSSVGSIAIAKEGNCWCCYYKTSEGHFFLMEDALNEVVKASNSSIDEIGEVCVCSGPGYFTGLRIGVAFAKGLAFGKNISIKYIPSVNAILSDFEEGKFLVSMEVGGGDSYLGFCEKKKGKIKKIKEFGRVGIAEAKKIVEGLDDDVLLAGELFQKIGMNSEKVCAFYTDALGVVREGVKSKGTSSPVVTEIKYI